MSRIFSSIVLGGLLLAASPGPLEAQCQTRFRIWQDGNNSFFKYGETIALGVGDKVDLYIHAYPSRSEHPYSASADIGAPTAFGVGRHRPQDVDRVLRLGKHDPRKGKIQLTAIAPGTTGLGYQITAVVRPGRLEEVPRNCRIGEVKIAVRGAAASQLPGKPPKAPAPVASVNDAVHELITQLYSGILRRNAAESADYPDSFFDQVQRDGQQGLISIAETMVSSPEFRQTSLTRTSQALAQSGVATRGLSREVLMNQLLTDIFTSLYGAGSVPYPDAQRRMASYLSDCILGRQGTDACTRLGRDLLTQPQYQNQNRDLLQYLR